MFDDLPVFNPEETQRRPRDLVSAWLRSHERASQMLGASGDPRRHPIAIFHHFFNREMHIGEGTAKQLRNGSDLIEDTYTLRCAGRCRVIDVIGMIKFRDNADVPFVDYFIDKSTINLLLL